jgi:hypothetical protein
MFNNRVNPFCAVVNTFLNLFTYISNTGIIIPLHHEPVPPLNGRKPASSLARDLESTLTTRQNHRQDLAGGAVLINNFRSSVSRKDVSTFSVKPCVCDRARHVPGPRRNVWARAGVRKDTHLVWTRIAIQGCTARGGCPTPARNRGVRVRNERGFARTRARNGVAVSALVALVFRHALTKLHSIPVGTRTESPEVRDHAISRIDLF